MNGLAVVDGGDLVVHLEETFGNCQQYIQRRPAEGPRTARWTAASDEVSLTDTMRESLDRLRAVASPRRTAP